MRRYLAILIFVAALLVGGCMFDALPAQQQAARPTRIERVVGHTALPAAEVIIRAAEDAEPSIRALEAATGRTISPAQIDRGIHVAGQVERAAGMVATTAALALPTPLAPLAGPAGAIAGLIGTIAGGVLAFLQRRRAARTEQVAVSIMHAVDGYPDVGTAVVRQAVLDGVADAAQHIYEAHMAEIKHPAE